MTVTNCLLSASDERNSITAEILNCKKEKERDKRSVTYKYSRTLLTKCARKRETIIISSAASCLSIVITNQIRERESSPLQNRNDIKFESTRNESLPQAFSFSLLTCMHAEKTTPSTNSRYSQLSAFRWKLSHKCPVKPPSRLKFCKPIIANEDEVLREREGREKFSRPNIRRAHRNFCESTSKFLVEDEHIEIFVMTMIHCVSQN